ncbi:Neuferricin, partial [Clarias magur]
AKFDTPDCSSDARDLPLHGQTSYDRSHPAHQCQGTRNTQLAEKQLSDQLSDMCSTDEEGGHCNWQGRHTWCITTVGGVQRGWSGSPQSCIKRALRSFKQVSYSHGDACILDGCGLNNVVKDDRYYGWADKLHLSPIPPSLLRFPEKLPLS